MTTYATDEAYVTDEAHGETLGPVPRRLLRAAGRDPGQQHRPVRLLAAVRLALHVQPEPARPRELLDARRVPRALRVHHPRAVAGHQAGPERLHPRPAGHHQEGGRRVHRPDRLPRRGHPRVPGCRVDLLRRGHDLEEPASPVHPHQGARADLPVEEPRLGRHPARARRLPADLQEAGRQRRPDPARGDHGRGHERRLDRMGVADLVRPGRRRGRRRGST